jgi:general secretion pathway protein A
MYVSFYKFSGRPFQLSPDPRFFYGSSNHQKAMAYLQYGLNQGEGFIVVTGDIGAGKTTLVGHLLEQLDSAKFLAGKLVTTQLQADDTLRMVASAFGLPMEGVDKATLLRKLETFLLDNQRRGRRVLLLIDEVQNLPASSLEELRMLSNFQAKEIPPIQFYLLGQPQFQQTLASDELVQLRQRVIATYHLGPLNPDETKSYVEHRLRLVDWKGDPEFTEDAFVRIHHNSGGVPRQVNTLCSRLLLYGTLEELHRIDGRVVEEVAQEMFREGMRTNADIAGLASVSPPAVTRPALADRHLVNDEVDLLDRRVAALEKSVKVQGRTIKRAIELAASYLDGSAAGSAATLSAKAGER